MGPFILVLILFLAVIYACVWWKGKMSERNTNQRVDAFIPPASCAWSGKSFLVVVNPYSGEKKGRFILNHIIKPMCKKANIKVTAVETKHEKHAAELGKNFDLTRYNAVLIVSGDGLVHQFLNGMAARFEKTDDPVGDFLVFLKGVPIGILPGGTSNGLSTSLGGRHSFTAMSNIINGSTTPVDLCQFQEGKDGAFKWDCHVFSWGAIADHDELVERQLRWMGGLRTIYGPLHVICRLKPYHGRLKILPKKQNPDDFEKRHYENPDNLEDDDENEGWKVIEDDFIVFSSTNTAEAAHDIMFSPHAKKCEGAVDILIVREGVGRLALLLDFMRFGHGGHIEQPEFEVYKVKSYVLQPSQNDGNMSLSGEPLKHGIVTMKVFEGAVNFIC